MAKQPKPKQRTAEPVLKPKTGVHHRKSPQTPIALILMGKGSMVNVRKRWAN